MEYNIESLNVTAQSLQSLHEKLGAASNTFDDLDYHVVTRGRRFYLVTSRGTTVRSSAKMLHIMRASAVLVLNG